MNGSTIEQARFHAMGCAVHVIVVNGPPGTTAKAQHQINHLESIWSRFRPTSDISRCNAATGQAVPVSPLTVTLVAHAVHGWQRTGGRFDPTVLTTLEALGYDRSFEQVGSSPYPPARAEAAPGCAGIVVDPIGQTVTIPPGVRFDPGGIGKGLAADLVCQALVADGASGACVNLGGDLRVVGDAPEDDGWIIGLEDPFDQQAELARATMADAGVATTSRTYRTWERAGVQVHHLLDPATGAPAWTDLASVTVVADSAAWAEVLAKAAFIAGPEAGAALIGREARSGVLVDDGGLARPLAGLDWEMVAPCLP